MQRILRRGIVVAALLTTITPALSRAVPGGTGGPGPGRTRSPASTGADWLAGQLTDGLVHNDQYAFDDYGLTIDVALGLAAVGGQDARVATVAGAVADHVESYTTGVDYGSSDVYAGATAKALHLADVAGADPTAFGGTDLVARLEGLTTDAGPSAGRIADQSEYGDYANTIGQAFAASGLDAAGSTEAAAATTYLLDQQCSDGWFRLLFTTDATAADQSCDGGVASGASKADPDTTSLAVILLADQADDPTVAAALTKAEAWLLDQQHDDGSFGGGTSTEAANSNSTGLAGWALGVRGHTAEAERAAVWVRGLQAADTAPCTTALTGETGAIAYDAAAFETGRTEGITDGHRRPVAPGLRPGAAGAALGAGRHRGVRRDRADRLRPRPHHGLAQGHRARPGRRRVPLQRLREAGPHRDRRHPAPRREAARRHRPPYLHAGLAGRHRQGDAAGARRARHPADRLGPHPDARHPAVRRRARPGRRREGHRELPRRRGGARHGQLRPAGSAATSGPAPRAGGRSRSSVSSRRSATRRPPSGSGEPHAARDAPGRRARRWWPRGWCSSPRSRPSPRAARAAPA